MIRLVLLCHFLALRPEPPVDSDLDLAAEEDAGGREDGDVLGSRRGVDDVVLVGVRSDQL